MPKATLQSDNAERQSRRHNPLADEYAPTSPPAKHRHSKGHKHIDDAARGSEKYVDSKASQKILRIGQDLVEEAETEKRASDPNLAFSFASRIADDNGGDTVDALEEEEAWGDEDEEIVEEVEIDPNDREVFDKFNPGRDSSDPSNLALEALMSGQSRDANASDSQSQTVNLADLILEKIAMHEAATGATNLDDPTLEAPQAFDEFEDEPLPPKVVQVYTQIGQLLSRHRSGPLPKPFKILPTLPSHQIPLLLSITEPMSWTPHAHFASVRLFISAKPNIATPYLRDILLPRIRDDIAETKKLHTHLYGALKKALYKPACFFKGVLFPLLDGTAEGGECTLREAHILGSVLTRVSVPVLHSAAALLRLCDVSADRFSTRVDDGAAGAVNTFVRVLLSKKYALPYKVVDALVLHFARFKALKTAAQTDGELGDVSMTGTEASYKPVGLRLPVLWHQSFLAFAQRYRNDITEEQREALLDTVNAIGHPQMGPEIRRELLEGRGRGVAPAGGLDANGIGRDNDDTMMTT